MEIMRRQVMMKLVMMLCQLSYDVVANAAGIRTRNPQVNNVVPPAFAAYQYRER